MSQEKQARVLSKVLLTAPFRYPDQWMLFGRAKLFEDRISLFSIHLTGIRRRTLLLADLVGLEWWSGDQGGANLHLDLKDGSSVLLWVKGAGLWKFNIQERAPNLKQTSPAQVTKPVAPAA